GLSPQPQDHRLPCRHVADPRAAHRTHDAGQAGSGTRRSTGYAGNPTGTKARAEHETAATPGQAAALTRVIARALTSARLRLRAFAARDLALFRALYTDPETMRFIARPLSAPQ